MPGNGDTVKNKPKRRAILDVSVTKRPISTSGRTSSLCALFIHLRRKGKAHQPRCNKHAGRGCIKNRVSVDEKTRVGDWEIDLVIGKGHSDALVTIVERKTKFTVSMRTNGKTVETVTAATIAASFTAWNEKTSNTS